MVSTNSLSIFLLGQLFLASDAFQLQILHHNDWHAKFEQTNANSGVCTAEEIRLGQCYGGIARIKTAIEKAKKEADSANIPTIVVNAGDFFIGTSYYIMKKWELVVPMVNALNYDIITVGNHDFDDGIDNLISFIDNVNVPVVCCNLDLDTEPRFKKSKLIPSFIKEINGTKIGFIGSVTPWTKEFSQTENLEFLNEIDSVQAEARKLRDGEDKVRIIIALSHSGFEDDVEMAEKVPELSLIVSSHSHTLLYTPRDQAPDKEEAEAEYPHVVTNKESGRRIPIVQSYAFGKYLGKLLVTFNDEGEAVTAVGNNILLKSTILEDEAMKELVEYHIAPLRETAKSAIAFTRVPLQVADFGKHQFESTLANLVTDILVDSSVQRAQKSGSKQWTTASIALMNTGGFLKEFGFGGGISMEDLIDSFKSGNMIFEATYPGSVLREALEYSLIPAKGRYHFPNYLYVSGLRVVYDLSKPEGQRVELIEVLCSDCLVPRYEKFEPDRKYTVVLPRFICKGGQGFTMLKDEAKNVVNLRGIQVRDLVEKYIRRVGVVYPILDDRVTIKNYNLP